jgi:hypothetical protein
MYLNDKHKASDFKIKIKELSKKSIFILRREILFLLLRKKNN